jgi:hypothetical protein
MAYQDVHQAAPSDAPVDGDNYEPTEQEEKDIRLAEKMFEQNKKAKCKYDESWQRFYSMFRGKQWQEQRPSYRHSEVINLIFREIQSAVPIILDSRPKFDFLPMEPGDVEFAEIVNQVCEADWNRYNWLAQLTENVYDSNILGTGVGGMSFEQKKENGVGAICFESEDPFYHFPSANARDVNLNNKVHIKAEPMSISDIKAKWPNGKYVKPDLVDMKKMDFSGKDNLSVRTPTNVSILASGDQQYGREEEPQVIVITMYIDGEFEIEEEEVPEHADDGTVNVKYVQKKKFPRGRKVVVASKVVLESGENEYEDGKFPFARLQNYVNQRQFWGISDIEQLESPQKVFNKLISFSLDVLTLMGNPIWKVGTASGVDTENLFNQPGLIIEADDIDQVKREEGVQLQPYVLQLIDRMKLWFDDVSGNNDVSRGARPEGVTAASAIQSLQEAAQTRIRQKSRNLDAYLQDLGQLYLSRVLQFYTAPRVFRLTNKDGSMKFFKFHVEPLLDANGQPTDQKVAKYRPFDQGEDGKLFEGEEKQVAVGGMLDVKVNTGSSLPFIKANDKNEALQLFDRGILDDEEILKRFDYPNWEQVLARVTEKKAMAAQEQMMAQAGPAA